MAKEKCRNCKYHGYSSGFITCDYLVITGHSRGCKPGENCEKYERSQKARCVRPNDLFAKKRGVLADGQTNV